jgi:Uncharacterized protein encoded in toxicity protection region of plasmid R478, contains von Willebrand factor (vWF) domain
MKSNITELVFVLDRSGSMSGLESDTIGGYNAFLKKQKKVEGTAYVTTVLFDDEYELLHYRENIKEVKPVTEKEYYVRGCTALMDAIGKTIHKVSETQRNLTKKSRADQVIFVITTDGLENASVEYSVGKVKNLIENYQKEYDWQFIFLGANIDAVDTASQMGIRKDRAVNFHADSKGLEVNYRTINEAVTSLREMQCLDENWAAEIEQDFKSRKAD